MECSGDRPGCDLLSERWLCNGERRALGSGANKRGRAEAEQRNREHRRELAKGPG